MTPNFMGFLELTILEHVFRYDAQYHVHHAGEDDSRTINLARKDGILMSRFLRMLLLATLFCWFAVSATTVPAFAGEDWLPVAQEELKMTKEPKAPGAPALYLYRQVDRDDVESKEYHYARIKILTEEGRKYANMEIPFVKGAGNIKGIQARTIHSDGSIVNFDGKINEQTIVKARGLKYLAKTFTMPDVQAGSIIEYRFTRILPAGYVYDSQWLLSEELFTKYAKFSLRKNKGYALEVSWPRGLPEGTQPPAQDHDVVRLETQDIPAFQVEDYMPPPDDMKYRVDFMYRYNAEKDPDKFWKAEGIGLYGGIDAFTKQRKAMEGAVSQIVSPGDTSEVKLQKIYARCQKIRNLSFEREKTEKESDREKLKDAENVADVWKHGYGNATVINWLFLALARGGGFDASPVMVATRDQHFFSPELMNAEDLNTNVVLVKLNGKDLYLDPGFALAPFGLLPWHETGVSGLRLDKDGGTWTTTTMPGPQESGVERKATLQLTDSGDLEGKVSITFRGLSALSLRTDEHDEDNAGRKKFLEDQLKAYVPVPIEAELTNAPDWDSSSSTLVAEYSLKVPDWASAAGHRTVLAAALFGGGEKHLFEHAVRVHPIYFEYPYSDVDDVTITPPAGLQVTGLPQPKHTDLEVCAYSLTAESKSGSLHLNRNLMVNLSLLQPGYYGALREFFQVVRSGDEQQIVLQPAGGSMPQ